MSGPLPGPEQPPDAERAGNPVPRRGTSPLGKRFRWLAALVAPVLDPRGLACALALATTLLGTTFCQFATPLFEAFPTLAWLAAGALGAEALALGAAIVARRRFTRGPLVALGLAALAFLTAMGCAGAKLQWQRGLAGNPAYTLPATPTRFPPDALDVDLRTSDGVPLRATQLGGRRPQGVVIVPSWRSNRDGFAIATLATWLANDLDVLVIDPRGQGESGGVKTPDGAERFDVIAGVGYMRSIGHARVAVLAEQDAAPAAIQAAAERAGGVDALALVGPSQRWGESLGSHWDPRGVGGRFYWRIAAGLRIAGGLPAPSPAGLLKQVAPVPVLLLGTKGDPGTPLDVLHLAAGEPKSLILVGGEGRPVAWSHFAAYYQAVSQWLRLTLDAG